MIAALVFQGVSLCVGVASVPILLTFLSDGDFLAWILIATFGALTIQVEQGIQIVATRRLAMWWHRADAAGFRQELALIRRRFRLFSAGVVLCLGTVGFLYFGLFVSIPMSETWPLTWALFVLAYGMNYWFGSNNVILLATVQTTYFNLTNALTRSVNLALTVLLLWQGLAILGLAGSFFVSVALSVALLRLRARHQLRTLEQAMPSPDRNAAGPETVTETGADTGGAGATLETSPHTRLYTVYTISNFSLYKGAFLFLPLVAAAGTDLSAYGLSLQLVAIVYTIAIVPTQVWLDRLMRAALDKSTSGVLRHLAITFAFGASAFLVAYLALVLLGRPGLAFLGSDVTLPSNGMLALIFAAFQIEAIIFVLVNLLLILNATRFLRVYVGLVWTSLALTLCGALLWDLGRDITLLFLLLPFAVQLCLSLPLALRFAVKKSREHGASLGRVT